MRGDVEGELSCKTKKSTKGCSEVIRTETVEAPTCFVSETNVGPLEYIPVSVTWLYYPHSAINSYSIGAYCVVVPLKVLSSTLHSRVVQ